MQKLLKRALTVVPIVAALLVVAYLVTHKPGPVQRQTTEAVQTLRVIAAPVVDWVPRAVGYGVAAPGTVWEAVAEAQGKIAAIHPLLKSGEVIAAQTVLVRIDPVEYELAVARLEAGVEETHANIRTLDEEQANTRLLMVIEQRSLELARQSLARKRTALARKAISQDEVDREERNVLLQQQQLRQIENTLALMPSRRKALDAALVVQQSHLEQARIDLTKTSIAAPFNCRLAEVRLEVGQYVRAGQTLFLAHGTNTTEIEARFSVEALRNLLGEERRGQFQPGLGTGTVQEIFGDVRVLISLESGDWSAQWDGRIERLREAVDAETREMKVVATVDRPYEKAQPGVRPPLTAGMFCRVELFAPARPDSVVVPRSSLKGDTLFVVDRQQRLQKVQVAVAFTQADVAVIRSGLSGGEQVVVSDPSPAIIGMNLAPVADEALRQHLLAASRGSDE
jgi:RND family efflux transporter MFP subunit